MILNPESYMRTALICLALLLGFAATPSNAAAPNCSNNCLSVYSIELVDVGTYINGTVKLIDETGAGAGARGTVVHAVWTRDDGSTLDQYANIGTRLRAEFRLYTAGASGTYTLTVVDATKADYTFDPENSTILSDSITVGTGSNQPPVAISNADFTGGSAPLTVNFNSYGSNDPDGAIAAYAWDFGDGNSSTEANPVHTYTAVGNYTASLLVTDNMGATASSLTTIIVTDSNAGCISNCMSVDKITLSYKAKTNSIRGLIWLLDENGSRVKGAVVHAVWMRPDGSTLEQFSTTRNRSLATFSLIAEAAGEYVL